MYQVSEEVKNLFRHDRSHKNIIISFPNGERADITNEDIVGESFSFTESICSRNKLKFGLCEASFVEFKVHGIENIEGATIDVTMEIHDLWDDIVYPLPIGRFVVKSCDKEADEDIRKVVAYDELKSSILDKDWTEKANEFIYHAPILYPMKKANVFFTILNAVGDTYTKRIGTAFKPECNIYEYDYGKYSKAIKVKVRGRDMWIATRVAETVYSGFQSEVYYRLGDFPIIQAEEYVQSRVAEFIENNKIEVPSSSESDFDRMIYNLISYVFYTTTVYEGYGSEKLASIWDYATNLNQIVVYQATGIALFTDSALEDKYSSAYILPQFHAGSFYPQEIEVLDMEKLELKPELRDFTPRKILSSVYELEASFGRIDRETHTIEGIPLPENALYPSEDLFPSEDLYPHENCDIIDRSTYKRAQFADRYVTPFGRIEYEYKTLNEEDKEVVEKGVHVIDESNEKTYEMFDNWLLHNTVQTKEQVEALIENMAQKIPSFEYCPAKVEAKGLLYLEAGDAISVYGRKDAFDTIIMRRTLSGIQSLTDEYEAK